LDGDVRMEIISLAIGFIIGVIIVSLAIEIGMRKTSQVPPASKHTQNWDINEITNPKVVAEYLSDIELPKGSKLVVNQYRSKDVLTGLDVKENKGVRGNFIVGDDRALILSGPMRKGEIGFWTVEKDIVEKLNKEFNDMWDEGTKMKTEETKTIGKFGS